MEQIKNRAGSQRKKSAIANESNLNVSGVWTMEDVFAATGLEMGSNQTKSQTKNDDEQYSLGWKKFGYADDEHSEFLQHLSTITWPEQIRFKGVFEKLLKSANKKVSINESIIGSKNEMLQNSCSSNNNHIKRSSLPHSIGLKQLGRSIKYMTLAEKRDKQKKKGV